MEVVSREQRIPTLSEPDNYEQSPSLTCMQNSPVTGNLQIHSLVPSLQPYLQQFEIVCFLIMTLKEKHKHILVPQFWLPHKLPTTVLQKFLRMSDSLHNLPNLSATTFLVIRPSLFVFLL